MVIDLPLTVDHRKPVKDKESWRQGIQDYCLQQYGVDIPREKINQLDQPRYTYLKLVRGEIVPVATLVEYFQERLREGDKTSKIAQRAGYVRLRRGGQPLGDSSHLQRLLGLRKWNATRKRNGKVYSPKSVNLFLAYTEAVKIAEAMNVDPCELGL